VWAHLTGRPEGEVFEYPGDGLGSAPAVFTAITTTAVTWRTSLCGRVDHELTADV